MPLREVAYLKAEWGLLDDAIGLLERAAEIEEAWMAHAFSLGSETQKSHWLDGTTNATLVFHAQHGAGNAAATKLAMTALLRTKGRIGDALASSLVRLRQQGEQGDAEALQLIFGWTSFLSREADWYAARSDDTTDSASKSDAVDNARIGVGDRGGVTIRLGDAEFHDYGLHGRISSRQLPGRPRRSAFRRRPPTSTAFSSGSLPTPR